MSYLKITRSVILFMILMLIPAFAVLAQNDQAADLFKVAPEEFEKADKLEKADQGPHTSVFRWWPTDAKPGPVPDDDVNKHGLWWWPEVPGKAAVWGNRGFVYVWKIIPGDLETGEPAFIIKKIINNVKVYFDYDKYELREDAIPILDKAIKLLNKHTEATVLITGNADVRGPEKYNMDLGKDRAGAVQNYFLAKDVGSERIKIISRGKLDAAAPVNDFEGMQKDRNAQFMVAEVIEMEVPAEEIKNYKDSQILEVQDIESAPQVSFEEYVVKKNDTLWSIANKVYKRPHRWKNIYNANRDIISDPNRLKAGTVIKLPKE